MRAVLYFFGGKAPRRGPAENAALAAIVLFRNVRRSSGLEFGGRFDVMDNLAFQSPGMSACKLEIDIQDRRLFKNRPFRILLPDILPGERLQVEL
jgi:hypothetical protein